MAQQWLTDMEKNKVQREQNKQREIATDLNRLEKDKLSAKDNTDKDQIKRE